MTTSFTEISLNEARDNYPLYPITKAYSLSENINLESGHYAACGGRAIVATDIDEIAVLTVEKTGNTIHRIYGCQLTNKASEEMIREFLDIYILTNCTYNVYIIVRNNSADQLLESIKTTITNIYANINSIEVKFINVNGSRHATAIMTKHGQVFICKHDERYVLPKWGMSS